MSNTMTDKEKKIEEMAKVTCEYKFEGCLYCNGKSNCNSYKRAEVLLPLIKHYQEQAIKEFVVKVKNKKPLFTTNNYGVSVEHGWDRCIKVLDETLKEFIGEKKL